MTGTIALNQGPDAAPLSGPPLVGPAVAPKRIVARLPVGLIADPKPVERCLGWQFLLSDGLAHGSECEQRDVVGVASVTAQEPGGAGHVHGRGADLQRRTGSGGTGAVRVLRAVRERAGVPEHGCAQRARAKTGASISAQAKSLRTRA